MRAQAWHDVSHGYDTALGGCPDEEVLDPAQQQGLVLVSTDTDFRELLASQNTSLPSLILFRKGNRAP